MKRLLQIAAMSLLCVYVAGCATSAEKVSAAYISPVTYKNFSCAQIREEATRVSQQVASLTGQQENKRENDAVATGVAIVLFWPAAFLIGGDDHTTAELAQMKGKFNALREESDRKRCNIRFEAHADSAKASDDKEKAPSRKKHKAGSEPRE